MTKTPNTSICTCGSFFTEKGSHRIDCQINSKGNSECLNCGMDISACKGICPQPPSSNAYHHAACPKYPHVHDVTEESVSIPPSIQSGEEWEETFYELTKSMDGQDRPKLKLLITKVRAEGVLEGKRQGLDEATQDSIKRCDEAYERGKQEGRREHQSPGYTPHGW